MEQIGLAAAGGEVSLWSLFIEAGFVVKLVMIGLLAASVWSWAIMIDKTLAFGRLRRAFDRFEDTFWSGQSLEELYRSLSDRKPAGMGALFVAAMREWKKSFERGARSPISLQSRIDRAMDVALAREMENIGSRLSYLASVGSAAPFIGLFGTVVGIMTSFQAIAGSESTNLAVVAPGIAEALLATALGLVAAIPAVIGYNKLSSDAGKLGGRMEAFADEFSSILSRQIDERASTTTSRAQAAE
ncbi:protein TolQ [Oricola cellulosilytica]|uniref:Tol-Pal system protein TolQ n=1 Tax=Oricola cellulosilytica TaxID=1429082 RepID=A0A4R0PFQ8_9HYPH|nr:protein TolQ [Oricola cellulosilytica]TCD15439.1 protein TolQ [Oricola cellulosilytica]